MRTLVSANRTVDHGAIAPDPGRPNLVSPAVRSNVAIVGEHCVRTPQERVNAEAERHQIQVPSFVSRPWADEASPATIATKLPSQGRRRTAGRSRHLDRRRTLGYAVYVSRLNPRENPSRSCAQSGALTCENTRV